MVVVGLNWQVLLLQLVILYTCLHIEPATIRLSPEEFFFPFIVEKIPYTVRAYILLHTPINMQEIWTVAKRPSLSKKLNGWICCKLENTRSTFGKWHWTLIWSFNILKSPKTSSVTAEQRLNCQILIKVALQNLFMDTNIALKWQSINLWKG